MSVLGPLLFLALGYALAVLLGPPLPVPRGVAAGEVPDVP